MQRAVAFTLLVVCSALIAGCGDSRHMSRGAQRAAIAATGLSVFPRNPGRTVNCRLPYRLSTFYFEGRCTSKVRPHGSGAEVSFEIAGAVVEPPVFTGSPTGPKGPTNATGATAFVGATRKTEALTGHLTFLVDRHNQAHFVEVSERFPSSGP